MPTKDIILKRKYRREWYYRNKEHARIKIDERRKQIKEWLYNKRSTLKCCQCGENHPDTLDFHHETPSEKEGNLGVLAHRGFSIKRLEEEISKCTILCANCHRKFHAEEWHGKRDSNP